MIRHIIRIWVLSLLIAAGLMSCGNQLYHRVPAVYIPAGSADFTLRHHIVNYKNQPFSGVQYALYPTGDTAFATGYYKGKQEGLMRQWYPGRIPEAERWYHEGKKTGLHKGWYPNGQVEFIAHMQDDHYEGHVLQWYANGQLYEDYHYKNGQEDGMEKMYAENGTLLANYQCIKGRKYGLTGVKGCSSVWADGRH